MTLEQVPQVLKFSCAILIPPTHHIHFHVHTALTRKTNRLCQEIFKKKCSCRISGALDRKYFHFLLVFTGVFKGLIKITILAVGGYKNLWLICCQTPWVPESFLASWMWLRFLNICVFMKKLSRNMLLIILFLSDLTSYSLGSGCYNNLKNPFQSLSTLTAHMSQQWLWNVFWDATACILVDMYSRFRGTCCPHDQG